MKKRQDKKEEIIQEKITKKQRRIISDERILGAALNEFAEKGYMGASLLQIAKNAGVSVGLIAQNFGCKELLFEAVYRRNCQVLNLPNDGKKKDWKARLEDILNVYKRKLQKNAFVAELQFISSALSSRDTPPSFFEYFVSDFCQSELFEVMKAGQKNGQIVKGEIDELYAYFYSTACTVLLNSKKIGVKPPQNDFFLSLITKQKSNSSK